MTKTLLTSICLITLIITGCAKDSEKPASSSGHQQHSQQDMTNMVKDHAMAAKPAIVNSKCPIMGSPIDPEKVPDSLYREFKGQGVGFCCGGCPGEWDKLSDEEKAAKLATSIAK